MSGPELAYAWICFCCTPTLTETRHYSAAMMLLLSSSSPCLGSPVPAHQEYREAHRCLRAASLQRWGGSCDLRYDPFKGTQTVPKYASSPP